MRRQSLGYVLAIASLAIGGCTALGTLQLTTGTARLEVLPQFVSGTYRAQALVEPWTPKDVVTVEVRLFTLSSTGAEAPALVNGRTVVQVLTGNALAEPFTFTGLAPHSAYRLRARAFKSHVSESSDVISADEASFLDVHLQADDRPVVATLSIRLQDVPFDGRGTVPALGLEPGMVVPAGSESLQLGELVTE